MKKVDERGFTLIELIIAITIFSVVIAIVYQIINSATRILPNQASVSKHQSSLNTINKYLSKDLEQSIKFTPPNQADLENLGDGSYYEYKLTTQHEDVNNNEIYNKSVGDKEIIYRVDISKKNKISAKLGYSLTRIDSESKLELVYNDDFYPKSENIQLPFRISEDKNISNFYNVEINYYKGNIEKVASFDVVSRYMESGTNEDESNKPDIVESNDITVANQVIIHNQPNGFKYWQELDKPHYRIGFAKSNEEDREVRNSPMRLNASIKIEYSKNLDDKYKDNFYDQYHDRVMKVELNNTNEKHFANRNQYNNTFKYIKCKKIMFKVQAGPDIIGPEQSSGGVDKVKFLKLHGVKINGEKVGDIEIDTIFEINNPTDQIIIEIEDVSRIDNGEADKYQHDDLFIKFGN